MFRSREVKVFRFCSTAATKSLLVWIIFFAMENFLQYPVTGLECSCGKIYNPVIEISVTGPTRLLIRIQRHFCKGKSGEARSRKPSQPG